MLRLILLAIGLVIILTIFLYWIGVNSLEKDYQVDYDRLVELVRKSKVSNYNRVMIHQRFHLIRLYGCRDKEQLDVLFRQFYNRFAEVWPKKK